MVASKARYAINIDSRKKEEVITADTIVPARVARTFPDMVVHFYYNESVEFFSTMILS